MLRGVDGAWHEVPGLLAGACGPAGEVLDGRRVWPQLLHTGLTVFSRLSVCRDLPNRFFKVSCCLISKQVVV